MIHYIQPYRIDRNIGKAINDAIIQLRPEQNDWICLTDHDVCFLRPDSKAQLEEILAKADYDLLSPVTNRLAMNHQLINGMFDCYDMREHQKAANACHEEMHGVIDRTYSVLAAFCLCFKVSTWEKLGRFIENSMAFDSLFSYMALNEDMKLGIMRGIYVYHHYRAWSDNPTQEVSHLLQE